MGFAAVILESIISALGFKKEMELDLISGIARYVPPLLGIYLVVRFLDLIMRGGLTSLGADIKGLMFIIENISYIVPLVILSSPKNRSNAKKLFISAVFLILAGGLYRFNVYLIGFDPGAGWRYFPSVQELIVTLGIISFEVMAYIVLVKKLPVLSVQQAEKA
jgi:Ni/Fe-hydrogenase subunit HybB-like protein